MPFASVSSPRVFPSFVAQHSVIFDPGIVDLANELANRQVPAPILGASRKRQVEFLAGRHCAREALRVCAPELAEMPIGSGSHREPIWPPGIVGSITHTAQFASVAVASRSHARAIGIDCEMDMEPRTATEVLP